MPQNIRHKYAGIIDSLERYIDPSYQATEANQDLARSGDSILIEPISKKRERKIDMIIDIKPEQAEFK